MADAARHLEFPTDEYAENSALRYFIDENGGALESMWHLKQIVLLLELTGVIMRKIGKTNFYVGGDQFIYYPYAVEKIEKTNSVSNNEACKGPDYFFIDNVPGEPHFENGSSYEGKDPYRRFWRVDEEGCYPDLIIELISKDTARVDKTTKKDIYEQTFETGEYFWYDHESRKLTGYRLLDHTYQDIPKEKAGESDRKRKSCAWRSTKWGSLSTRLSSKAISGRALASTSSHLPP